MDEDRISNDSDPARKGPEINEEIICRIELLKSLQESFECQRCGECCRQESIAFTESDLRMASERMDLSPLEFIEEYGLSMVNRPGEMAYYRLSTGARELCPFNSDRECTIYDSRPRVCRGFPFLTPENVQNAFQLNNVISICGKCRAAIGQVEGVFGNISIRRE